MKRFTAFVAFLFVLSGCSPILNKVVEVTKNDFSRTVELAEKYGKPEVKQCFAFLVTALEQVEQDQASLDALLAEDTAGIASAVLKAVLVKELILSLNDPVRQAQFEQEFDTNCRAVAGQIMLNMIRDARSVAQKIR